MLSHGLAVVSLELAAFQRASAALHADEPVTLDVVVTDAKSRPVKNLQPGDLELTDAGEAARGRRRAARRRAAGASSASFSTSFTCAQATRRSARGPR